MSALLGEVTKIDEGSEIKEGTTAPATKTERERQKIQAPGQSWWTSRKRKKKSNGRP